MRKLLVFVSTCLIALPGMSQGIFEEASEPKESGTALEWNGYVRGSAYGGSKQFDYSSLFGEAALQGKLTAGKAFLFADMRLREGVQFGETALTLQLKEAYAGYQSDKLGLSLGNQIMAWGRADGFNPTNNLTPRDYFLLTPEPDDQTLPNFLLRAKYHFKPEVGLEIVGIPFFRPSVYRYGLFSLGEHARFDEAILPATRFGNGALAARLDFELPRIGFSLSYFNGYDPFYGFTAQDIDLSNLLSPLITYRPDFYRKQSFGADFALPLGNWILRGEIACDKTKGYLEAPHVPNPGLYYVVGLERQLWDITAILQYIGKYTFDYRDITEPAPEGLDQLQEYILERIGYETNLFNRKIFLQQEQSNHALSLSLNRSLAHEVLRAECTVYYNLTSEEYLLRPALNWQANDALSATFGASIMGGPEQFIYDYAKEVLNGAFLQLKVRF